MTDKSARKPTVALAMGDPAGISPELTAKLLALDDVREAARLVVIGDRRVLEDGARIANVALDVDVVAADAALPETSPRPLFVDLGHLDPKTIERGQVARAGGVYAKENYLSALALAKAGAAHAVAFTPFNKGAMKLAEPSYDDEILFTARAIGFAGEAREFNVLDGLWNARVTSHVPLSAVAGMLSVPAIVRGLELTHAAMSAAGFSPPRIAVAALNPHAGDNGNFGREEIDILAPAVQAAQAEGIACDGPYPSDTVFVRARVWPVRRRADHVPRPGPDRHEADRLRQGRDPARRLPDADHDAGPRHGLRHRRQGDRQHRRQPQRGSAGGQDGARGGREVGLVATAEPRGRAARPQPAAVPQAA